jgi:hypothetical protein
LEFLTQGNQVAGVPLDPAGEFQFEQKSGDGSGRHLALAHQFVNRDRRGSQSFED